MPTSPSGNSPELNPVLKPQVASATAAAFHRASSTSAAGDESKTTPPPACTVANHSIGPL